MEISTDEQLKTHRTHQRKTILATLTILALMLVVNVTIYTQKAQASLEPTVDEQYLLTLINKERSARGLSDLTYNSKLASAARAKAADMIENGYFDHNSPDGKTPWTFIKGAGYSYTKAGENLAIDFDKTAGPVPAWMASPTHKANILKEDYKEAGIAELKGMYQGRMTTVVVQTFGTK